ncbi:MAG: nucleoside-diphosphate kinase [Candidatus Zixiibacteriota bacterium]|nr:MAG: nucleoside-diphosphate kinase [candidate division Zixibacteria bacterium]
MRKKSLLIIKPDAIERDLIGRIISRLESARFKILAMKMVRLTYDEARKFYAVHEGRPFLEELCQFMSSGPIVAMVLESDGDTVSKIRSLIGSTDPAKAAPGTIRHDFALSLTKNSVHASDGEESAKTEIAFFFS